MAGGMEMLVAEHAFEKRLVGFRAVLAALTNGWHQSVLCRPLLRPNRLS